MKLFCFGYGYCASHIAAGLPQGSVTGTHRSQPEDNSTIELFQFSDTQPLSDDALQALKTTSHVLISIPPRQEGDPVYSHYANMLAHSSALKWLGLFSATSVYGDHEGNWVDETTPPAPTGTRGKHRLTAK